jgi:hypothetical protein
MLGRERIYQLITEIGFYDAKKMLGMKAYDLFRISKYPIDCEAAEYILYELGYDSLLPSNHRDYKVKYDFDGILRWDGRNRLGERIIVMATPFWDGNCEVPVDVEVEVDSSYELYEVYPTPNEFETVEELLIWFKEEYLPKTYLTIKQLLDEN